jgi:sugar phosphate isomerase/epimerase
MRRREFLAASGAAVGAAFGLGNPVSARRPQAQQAKLDRLAIMTYSFQRILKAPNAAPSPARVLDFFDMPEMFADRFKVHNLEVQHSHFASTELSFFKDFLARLAKTKSRVSNINLELGNMTISSPDPILRAQAIDLTKRWIDHAVVLGSPRVMINQGQLTEEAKVVAIPALKAMGDYGKTKNVKVGMETRGMLGGGRRGGDTAPAAPTRPFYEIMAEVIKASGTTANPDIGNFGGDQAFQHAGMRVLFPLHGGNCHIKALTPPQYDLVAAIALTKELKYTGLYSIEFEGQGDNYEGVQYVYDALLANI